MWLIKEKNMNTINTVLQLAHLKDTIANFKFVSEFADGLCYNDPIMGEFNHDAPEIIISFADDDQQIYKHLIARGYACSQRGVNRYHGRCFGNGTNTDLHLVVAEDWELHHDMTKLTGLNFKLD